MSITVNTLVDEADGSIVDGDISLRDAIAVAPEGETIDFSVTGTINLSVGTFDFNRHLTIDKSLTISGPGASLLTLRAYDASGATGNGSRVFNIHDTNLSNFLDVSISGLTLTGGDLTGNGGAISNSERLSLSNMAVRDNQATGHGGAIFSYGAGELAISDCTITGNNAGFSGGGVWHYDSNITRSTISGNTASERGGGIYNTGKSTLADSTISGNRSLSTIFAGGGGIFNGYEMTVTNSTISGNEANFHGGGIDTRGMLTVKHSTITANRADTDGNGTGNGGGISVDAMVTNATIDHTIVAGNLRQVSTREDVFGPVMARYSLIGDNTGAAITDNGGNQIGTFSLPIDPLLGGLTDNVGPTRTHALLAFSPAIDAGELLFSPPPTNDQRGALFARVADGDGAGGARIDIGAYERQNLPPEFFVVDTLIDDDDGNYSPGDVSLREAIAATNGSAGADTITFAASLTSGGPATMLLLHGELAIGESLTISGPGAGLLTINASGSSRVLNIDDGKSASLVDVEISGLTLTGGNAIGSGGAIFTRENLIVVECVVTNNRTATTQFAQGGGAIYSSNGADVPNSLTIRNSTISDNYSVHVQIHFVAEGGGIRKQYGSLIVEQSSISDNVADLGGGISAADGLVDVQIRNSTIRGNSGGGGRGGAGVFLFDTSATTTITGSTISGNSGAGVYLYSATTTITGSTISGNVTNGSGGGILSQRGNLTVRDSTIDHNSASFEGGGIRAQYGSLIVERVSISNNVAGSVGGGISAANGQVDVQIRNSTIAFNRAGSNFPYLPNVIGYGRGGGVFLYETSATTTITGSTISGNVTNGDGGGIEFVGSVGSKLTVRHSTIAFNRADWIFDSPLDWDFGHPNGAGDGIGGGILFGGNSLELDHTIVANNKQGNSDNDIHGYAQVQTANYSLVEVVSGVTLAGSGNITGDDPQLGPLAENGGPTKTHALLAGSPAIDAGNPAFTPPPDFDQRGALHERVADGDGAGGPRIDIGAYERQSLPPEFFVVDTLVDEEDGDYSAGDRSLREVIRLPEAGAGVKIITFAAALTSGGPATILLTLGELAVNHPLTIDGPGANLLTIDASGNDLTPLSTYVDGNESNDGDGSRIFNIDDGTSERRTVSISGLTLTGGDVSGVGGAIRLREDLVVTDSVITGNSAELRGGGIANYADGSLTITASTISGNMTGFHGHGGGIHNSDFGSLSITDSTISGNSARHGGGIYGRGSTTVIGSTISGNLATGSGASGGGISASLTDLTITNSTISGNSADGRGGGVYGAVFGVTHIRHSTITNNRAGNAGGGVASRGNQFPIALTWTEIYSSIIAGNMGNDVDFGVANTTNSFSSLGYNIVGTGNAVAAFNQPGDQFVVTNAMLGPLAANGGPTTTHALLPGNPAIDAGDPTFDPADPDGNPMTDDAIPYDQRGTPFTRVFDGNGVGGPRIDIGAVERQPIPPAVFGDYNQNGTVDAADYVVWRKLLNQLVAPYSGADGDGDTTIDQDDYGVWRANFGMTVPAPGAGSAAGVPTLSAQAIQSREPAELLPTETTAAPAETDLTAARAAGFAPLDNPSRWQDSGSQSRGRIQRFGLAESGSEDLLLLAIDRVEHASPQDVAVVDDRGSDDVHADDEENQWLNDESPTTALAEWRSAWGTTGVVRR